MELGLLELTGDRSSVEPGHNRDLLMNPLIINLVVSLLVRGVTGEKVRGEFGETSGELVTSEWGRCEWGRCESGDGVGAGREIGDLVRSEVGDLVRSEVGGEVRV